MNKQMKAALEFLNMPGIRFALKHARGPLSSHGQDTVEFLISTNPVRSQSRWQRLHPAASFPALCLPSRALWPTVMPAYRYLR